MEKKILLIVIACCFLQFNLNKEIDKLIKDFKSNDWVVVLKAKKNLENLESKALHELIDLLKDESVNKLGNTGDLIYPGADKFFGHGQIINYDIDKISIRAGWLIEEMTFQNFGYSGIHIQENRIIDYIKFNFPEYYNNSSNRENLENRSTSEKRALVSKLSYNKVIDWWKKESKNWNRLAALLDALNSTDEKRQVKALFYLRNGTSKCTGLNKNVYESKIKKRIIELSKVFLVETLF
jgi:hypothetical protein